MNDQVPPSVASASPKVQAALREYLNRVDRGEFVDIDAFITAYSEYGEELRSFIVMDQQARRLAAPVGAKSPDAGDKAKKGAEVSTHSVAGAIDHTVGGRAKERASNSRSGAPGSAADLLSEMFGRYRIQKMLGSGAMGAVYLAEDTLLHRNVALKTPTFEDDQSGELLTRFYREARAVASLKHPNLCAVYDVGEINGRHYISMEFVPGKKLQDYIKPDKPMAEKQVMAVVRKIALAMQEAHSHGVIHRDLKPDNVMVNEKGEPVVMDFGLVHKTESKESTRITQRGMLVGSPAYMSKEQVEGDSEKLTGATDQYSLGVMFYQLLTSKLPFEGGIHGVLAAILTKAPTPPSQLRPDVNPHLEAICLKMMAKDAKDRYPSMKAVADAILDVSKGTSKAAGSVVVPEPAESLAQGLTASIAAGAQSVVPASRSMKRPRSMPRYQTRGNTRSKSNIRIASGFAAGLFLLLSVIFWLRSGNARVKITVHAEDVAVTLQDQSLSILDGVHEYTVAPGEHSLRIRSNELEFETEKFTLKRGENPAVVVELDKSEIVAKFGDDVITRRLAGTPAAKQRNQNESRSGASSDSTSQYLAFSGKLAGEAKEVDGQKFVWCPPGKFKMGTAPGEAERTNHGNLVDVTLTHGFWLSATETTQEQFEVVMSKKPWHGKPLVKPLPHAAASCVDYHDAVDYCIVRSQKDKDSGVLPDGWRYSLPTEAQWEYACRAGTSTAFSFGDDEARLGDYAWFGISRNATEIAGAFEVGQKLPNRWGLFDMSGNLWEWCSDWDATDLAGGIDPIGPKSGTTRVIRGGSWQDESRCARVGLRNRYLPTERVTTIGFRVAIIPSPRQLRDEPDVSGTTGRSSGPESLNSPANTSGQLRTMAGNSTLPAPADAVAFQNKRFKLFSEELTWHEARQKCESMGGRLAEVRSAAENDFLMKLGLAAKQTGLWLGATDEVKDGTWLWSDNSGLAFNYFANGQPDRSATGQHFLLMMLRDLPGQWCSQPDRSTFWTPGFVCEWDDATSVASNSMQQHSLAAHLISPLVTVPRDYDTIATGTWVRILNESPPLSDPTKIKLTNDLLEVNSTELRFDHINARNLILRAQVRKVSGANVSLSARIVKPFHFYSAWFDGGNTFGIGGMGEKPFRDLAAGARGPARNGFVELAFSLIDDTMTLYVDGKSVFSAKDGEHERGAIALRGHGGVSQFRDVELMVLDAVTAGAGPSNSSSNTAVIPQLVPITDPADKTTAQASAWVSADGMRMYWEQQDRPDQEYRIWQAERSAATEPFANHRVVGRGRQPTLTPDELQMICVLPGAKQQKRLFSATRKSIKEPFGQPQELTQFDEKIGFNSPFLSDDGLALFVTARTEVSILTAKTFVSRRSSLKAQWSALRLVDIHWDANAQQAAITWLAMAPDELSFLATHELDVGRFQVMKFTRKRKTEAFEKFEYLSLPGLGPVFGRSPRYIAATRELYLTAPADYSKAPTLAGWQETHRPVLWVVRNVDLLNTSKEHAVDASGLPSVPIPTDAETFAGHSYKYYNEQLSWRDAKAMCETLGGHMVIVDDAKENEFIGRLVTKAGSENCWIGITDEATEGRWLTVAGTAVSFTNWLKPHEPDNTGSEEHYALMSNRLRDGKRTAWQWHDQPNQAETHLTPGFVCEWSSVTTQNSDTSQLKATTPSKAKSVFNGRDLTGWTPMLTTGANDEIQTPTTVGWTVKGREIHCDTNAAGWLRLDQTYGDCEFQFEFFMPLESNSGILVRYPGQGPISGDNKCEIQLLSTSQTYSPDMVCGAIHKIAPAVKDAFRPGRWNDMTIRVADGQFTVRLNKEVVVDVKQADHLGLVRLPKTGHFGLYNWKGEAYGCRFRNLRILDLSDVVANVPPVPLPAVAARVDSPQPSSSEPQPAEAASITSGIEASDRIDLQAWSEGIDRNSREYDWCESVEGMPGKTEITLKSTPQRHLHVPHDAIIDSDHDLEVEFPGTEGSEATETLFPVKERFQVRADTRQIFTSPLVGIMPLDIKLPADTTTAELRINDLGNSHDANATWWYPELHQS